MEEKAKGKVPRKVKQNIDEEVLTNSIVNALVKYDEKKKELESKEYYEPQKNEKLGFKTIIKMLVFPKKYLNTQGVNESVFKGILKFIYKSFEYLLLVASVLLLLYIPLQFCVDSIKVVAVWVDILYVCGAIIGILISRVLRIMALDIERIKDKNFLIALLSAIIALISIIIAIVK